MKNRVKLGNKKDKIIRANIPDTVTTVEQLVKHLNNGFFADVENNNETDGADAGVAEIGTPLNKATLLSDGTAQKLQLTQNDPTINDAFSAIAGFARIATGTYTGNGAAERSINIKIAAKIIFVVEKRGSSAKVPHFIAYSGWEGIVNGVTMYQNGTNYYVNSPATGYLSGTYFYIVTSGPNTNGEEYFYVAIG